MAEITLLLADDHDVVRSGLRMLLEAQNDMHIVGEAKNGMEAIELTEALKPDVVLMDIMMPELNGIESTKEITERVQGTAVLALTMYEDEQYFIEMLSAGAIGYVPKRAAPDVLVTAIHAAKLGAMFIYPPMVKLLIQGYVQGASSERNSIDRAGLTPREFEVLILIAEGLKNIEISSQLEISVKTVDRHRDNIMRKLDLQSRIDLVKFAIREGLIDINNS